MKHLLLTLFLATSLSSIFAQSKSPVFGVKAGLNFANLISPDDDEGELSRLTTFHFGATAEFGIGQNLSLQPELLFSARGATTTEDSVEAKVKYNYIVLPVMLKYYAQPNFSVEFGPSIGFLTSAKVTAANNTASVGVDVKKLLNSTDFGLNLGLGYKLNNGINFSTRYYFGLSEVYKKSSDTEKAKHSVFQISVGYTF